jgi:Mn2+/Fe2+ NRAMP family transporter
VIKVLYTEARCDFEAIPPGTYDCLFIMLDVAAVLHAHEQTDIQTATQAASALRQLAGEAAFLLFSAGTIGTGLLAVPTLAGSAAYALAETLKWPIGFK